MLQISLLGMVINDRVSKSETLLFTVRMGDFVVCHDEHGVCPFLSPLVISLCHPTKILSECDLPNFSRCGVVHQLAVTWYGFTHDWMYHRVSIMFKFDIEGRQCMSGKHCWVESRRWTKGFVYGWRGERLLCDQPRKCHQYCQLCLCGYGWSGVIVFLNYPCQFWLCD